MEKLKVKFKITDYEKEILLKFKNQSYPSIYKTDATDNILFIETVDFDVCSYLLKEKQMEEQKINEIMNSYQKFLSQVKVDAFDEYALEHYNSVVEIMNIFKKY